MSLKFEDMDIIVNSFGGKQSKIETRLDLFPPEALLMVGKVLAEGATKYSPNNWRKISRADHINHALEHLARYMDGQTNDSHFEHFVCRVVMASAVPEIEPLPYKDIIGICI